jgi:hypothetical protein
MTIEKFDVLNRWTNAVQFTAEINTTQDMLPSIKLGLAIMWGVKNGVKLRGANLAGAYLSGFDLRKVGLRDVNLSGAYLSGANLSGANLGGANLSDANLNGTILTGAEIRDVILTGSTLTGAEDADYAIAQTRILPDGDLIGWKKCQAGVIVRLRIPEDAPRSHAFGRKCRAKFVDVLEVIGASFGISSRDAKTIYRVGERIEAPNWSDDWQTECAGGIHFFITRLEAENHYVV